MTRTALASLQLHRYVAVQARTPGIILPHQRLFGMYWCGVYAYPNIEGSIRSLFAEDALTELVRAGWDCD